MLTVAYSQELDKEGFTVFCVSPGVSYAFQIFAPLETNVLIFTISGAEPI